MTREEQDDLINKHADELAEHFDTVWIFTTVHEPTTERGTLGNDTGRGNFYAVIGQVREWLMIEEADIIRRRTQHLDDEEAQDQDTD